MLSALGDYASRALRGACTHYPVTASLGTFAGVLGGFTWTAVKMNSLWNQMASCQCQTVPWAIGDCVNMNSTQILTHCNGLYQSYMSTDFLNTVLLSVDGTVVVVSVILGSLYLMQLDQLRNLQARQPLLQPAGGN